MAPGHAQRDLPGYVLVVLSVAVYVPAALVLLVGAGPLAAAVVYAAVTIVDEGSLTYRETFAGLRRCWWSRARGRRPGSDRRQRVRAPVLLGLRPLAWPLAVLVLYLAGAFGLYQLLLWPLAVQDPERPLREALRDAGVALVRRPVATTGLAVALLLVNLLGSPWACSRSDDHDRVLGARGRALRAAPERGGRGEAMAGVTYENVWKRFDGTVAVKTSLAIDDGEFMVLVGPSGCGKSTALRMLAGLERCYRGPDHDRRAGRQQRRAGARDVAMVFQSYALYPHMTVYDNLAFALRNQRVPRAQIDERQAGGRDPADVGAAEAEAEAALGWAAAARRARARDRARAGGLPDGRAALEPGREAARRDARRSSSCRNVSARPIYVTHDQVEAMTMGDRIAVMRRACCSRSGRRRSSTPTRATSSSPASSARRR